MVTVVQQLTVIQQFKIEQLSWQRVDWTLVVLIFFLVACVIHGICMAIQQKGLQLSHWAEPSVLGSTVGTLFMVFFISVCSSLLAPFRCYTHPNEESTVQAYHSVLCNMQDEHLQMSLVGGFCCLLPIGFLSVCSYLTLVQLPKWIANGEAELQFLAQRLRSLRQVRLIRACSFLFVRFRPGAEAYSVLFLLRNALVVLCPLLPSSSGRILCMNLILYGSLVMVAYGKPWRHQLCNALDDLFLLSGMLVILDMGSLFIRDVDMGLTAAICIVFSVFMCLSVLLAMAYGLFKHIVQKLEFSYVGQDTQTLLILGSPQILTRKWCVGEMVTGRLQKVHTVLLAFPGFEKPDQRFIETYTTLVPDITELANYNIGLDEVEATLRWINDVTTIQVGSKWNLRR
eukprot:Skav227032  [mRNA]  locus=scaffold635:42932:52073:- [translate_table: standard]